MVDTSKGSDTASLTVISSNSESLVIDIVASGTVPSVVKIASEPMSVDCSVSCTVDDS